MTDFKVCFNDETFLTVTKGQIEVHGADFPADLANISKLIGILSEVMNEALNQPVAAARTPAPAAAPVRKTDNVVSLFATG